MCKSVFENLYYGKINPHERKIEPTVEGTQIEKEIETEKFFLRSQLSKEAYQRFELLECLYTESSEMESLIVLRMVLKLGR